MATALPSPNEKRKTSSENHSNGNESKKSHWSAALSTAIEDESVQLYKDDLCTVIQDKFPKVFIFFLLLTKQISIVFILGSYSFTCYA